ncbi:unnamed protein product [Effrenium voratum]|uniref:Uncharacterized protein n=1 Tax=Effrenium voratum TaxID=2562239 RepID=A0AA36JLT5_9DINO|nr:unnamed protein product [Effrenium voratum]CAJ1415615.1 unnamed protein product [Effrenium voratum]
MMQLPLESECTTPDFVTELLSENDTVLTFVCFVLGWLVCRAGLPTRVNAAAWHKGLLGKLSEKVHLGKCAAPEEVLRLPASGRFSVTPRRSSSCENLGRLG